MNTLNEHLLTVAESETVELSRTKGVKFYCVLSDCNFFHIIDHPSIDIMHDVNEGAIPFLIENLLRYCTAKGIFSLSEIDSLVKFHDYGILKGRVVPSELKLKKRSLGQNASQSLCLFQNLPFILYKYRNDETLASVWDCVNSLLRITEIIYSWEFTDEDLRRLQIDTTTHLEGTIQKFGRKLIPKLHNLLHYPGIFRIHGSGVNMTMMRYESKHKVFKSWAKNTNNFRNINKTLAVKHQELLCSNGFTYTDDLECGKLRRLNAGYLAQHESLIRSRFTDNPENVFSTKWLTFNNYEYRKGLMIVYANNLHEIIDIFCDGSHYYFMTKQWTFAEYNVFLNSFEIRENELVDVDLIGFNILENKKPYQVKSIENKNFVVPENLDLTR